MVLVLVWYDFMEIRQWMIGRSFTNGMAYIVCGWAAGNGLGGTMGEGDNRLFNVLAQPFYWHHIATM